MLIQKKSLQIKSLHLLENFTIGLHNQIKGEKNKMIKSKYMFILVIFAVVAAFAIQSIGATYLDSNDYSID